MKESKKILFHKLLPKQPKWLKVYIERFEELISLKELANVAPSNIFDHDRSLTEL